MVCACLLLLLAFTTLTVFVRTAWALQFFEIGVFALLAADLLAGMRKKQEYFGGDWTSRLIYLIPCWGGLQLVAHTTASTFNTRVEVLRWCALAAVFFLVRTLRGARRAQRFLLSAFLYFAVAMAVLCLLELPTAEGRALWLFPTGYPFVYATFAYRNNYAQFVELALPIALWRALREKQRSWWYALMSSLLFASVVASATRSGTVMCVLELLTMLAIGLKHLQNPRGGPPARSTLMAVVLIPLLAAVFTLAAGWQPVWHRFQQKQEFGARRYFLEAAIAMTRQRPLTGFGLGTFPEVYQRYATKDFAFYANHAHNDWAEFAAEGGIPFLLLVLIPLACLAPAAIRHPWGLGLIVIMLHACVDYPFPRPAVSGWLFAIAALLSLARREPEGETLLAGHSGRW